MSKILTPKELEELRYRDQVIEAHKRSVITRAAGHKMVNGTPQWNSLTVRSRGEFIALSEFGFKFYKPHLADDHYWIIDGVKEDSHLSAFLEEYHKDGDDDLIEGINSSLRSGSPINCHSCITALGLLNRAGYRVKVLDVPDVNKPLFFTFEVLNA